MVGLRLVQGLALAASMRCCTYVAEHAPRGSRLRHELDPDHGDPGLLPVARGHRDLPHPDDAKVFADWGWRVPFLVSLIC